MAKISKAVVDADLRKQVFSDLITDTPTELDLDDPRENYIKINDRQYGVLLTDLNGVERYVRVSAIVAEERTDATARELMQREIDAYKTAQATKAENARKAAEKAAADKAKREARAKKKAEEEAE